jgi:hypothetical protein
MELVGYAFVGAVNVWKTLTVLKDVKDTVAVAVDVGAVVTRPFIKDTVKVSLKLRGDIEQFNSCIDGRHFKIQGFISFLPRWSTLST